MIYICMYEHFFHLLKVYGQFYLFMRHFYTVVGGLEGLKRVGEGKARVYVSGGG